MAEKRMSSAERENHEYNYALAYANLQKYAAKVEAAEAIGKQPDPADLEKANRFADQVENYVSSIETLNMGSGGELPFAEKAHLAYETARATVEGDANTGNGYLAAARSIPKKILGVGHETRPYSPWYSTSGGAEPDYSDFDVMMNLPTAGAGAAISGAVAVGAKRYAQKKAAQAVGAIGLKKTGKKVAEFGSKEIATSIPGLPDWARKSIRKTDLSLAASGGAKKAAKSIANNKPVAAAAESVIPVPVPPPPVAASPLGLPGPMPNQPMIGFGTPAMTEAEIIMAQKALKNPATQELRGEGAKRAMSGSPWGEAPPTKPLTTPVKPGQVPIAGALPNASPQGQILQSQIERLSKEVPLQPGYRRLYRAEHGGTANKTPEWMQNHPEFIASKEASGRWFTEDINDLGFYARDNPEGQLSFVDVPESAVEGFRVSNLKGAARSGENPSAYSANPRREFFLSKEMASKKTPFHKLGESASEPESIGYERALQSILMQPEAIPYGARLPLRLDLIRGNTAALNAVDEGLRTQRIRLLPDGHLESLVQTAPPEVASKSVIDAAKRAFDARSPDRTDWWTR